MQTNTSIVIDPQKDRYWNNIIKVGSVGNSPWGCPITTVWEICYLVTMTFDVFECIQCQPLWIWTNLSTDNDIEGQGKHCAEYNGEKIASAWNMFSKLDKSSDQWL